MNWDAIGIIINWGVLVFGAGLSVYNYRSLSSRNEFLNKLSKTETIQKLSETLDIAADRNLKYETQRKADRDEIFLLEKRLATLESNMQYRLTFDVLLGTEPNIEKANIQHMVERRQDEEDVDVDRRRKM